MQPLLNPMSRHCNHAVTRASFRETLLCEISVFYASRLHRSTLRYAPDQFSLV